MDDIHLVAGCSLGYKSHLLHINGWDMDQTKKSLMISVILGICSNVNFKSGLKQGETSWLTAETDSWLVENMY